MPQLSKLPDLYPIEHSREGMCMFFVSNTLPLTISHYNQGLVQSEQLGDQVPCLKALGQEDKTFFKKHIISNHA